VTALSEGDPSGLFVSNSLPNSQLQGHQLLSQVASWGHLRSDPVLYGRCAALGPLVIAAVSDAFGNAILVRQRLREGDRSALMAPGIVAP
jgi:hypothetical protein